VCGAEEITVEDENDHLEFYLIDWDSSSEAAIDFFSSDENHCPISGFTIKTE